MMIETEADRLEMIRSLDGRCVRHAGGEFWAILDNGYIGVSVSDLEVEERGPRLTCRTSDVIALRKDAALEVGSETYRLLRAEPDGTGMTVLILKE